MKKVLSYSVCAACAALGFVASAVAANVTLTWDSSATPATLGSAATGQLAFTYSDGVVSNVTATPVGGGTITLTGDAMNLCTNAHIIMAAGGELVFKNKVSGLWNINAESTVQDRTLEYAGANLGTEYTLLFPGANLDEWAPLKTGNVGGKGWWQKDGISTYHIRRETDGTVTAQRQAASDDGDRHLALALKFLLAQTQEGIAGRVLYTGYWNRDNAPVGSDADEIIANPETYGTFSYQKIATPTESEGYGICKMTLSRVAGLPTVRFAGGLTDEGVIYARPYTRLVYERAVTGSIKRGYQADANGVLTFRDPVKMFDPSSNAGSTAALAGGVAGPGTVEFEATDTLYGDEEWRFPSYGPWLTTNWVVVATGWQLSDLTNATAYFDGGGMNSAHRNKIEPIKYLEIAQDGQSATGQFQHKSGWSATPNQTQGVLVEFRQSGADVEMRAAGVGMVGGADNYDKVKLEKRDDLWLTDNSTSYYYGLHNVSLQFRSSGVPVKSATMGRYPGIRNMAGSTATPGCRAQVVVRGTENTIMVYDPSPADSHVLPYTDGLLRVQKGGEVVQRYSGLNSTNSMWVEDRALIRIEDGGAYRQQSDWGVGVSQRVEIVSGEYRVRDLPTVTSGRSLVNYLTLSGGARILSMCGATNDYIRAGYMRNAIWFVRGTSPSYCDAPVRLWGAAEYEGGGNTMTFAVLDVTGDDASDFVLNGGVSVDANEPDVLGIYKTNPGTMELTAPYRVSGKTTYVNGGTLLFNGTDITSPGDVFAIDGTKLAFGAATSNEFGRVVVGENGGEIVFGAGAKVMFADQSGVAWIGTGTLTLRVDGFAEKSIRFGKTHDALTEAQRARMQVFDDATGEAVKFYMRNDGFLTAKGPSLAIIVK